ncbi:MAG: hypothetical protein KGJ90_07315, partial [Patescibacteria group bacterium]|nr:hypothetical protein [Patescibacteria group bacterium]
MTPEKIIEIWDNAKRTFEVRTHGSVTDIYENGEKCNFNGEHNKIHGVHIFKVVSDELTKRIASGEYTMPTQVIKPYPFCYSMYNPKALRKLKENDKVVAVDMSNCYWETAKK